jgi:hypothetical protein
MDTLLELIHEYRSLQANVDPTRASRARLMGLGSLLGTETPWEPCAATRKADSHAIRFTVPGGFGQGEIRTLTGAGVVVSTRKPPEVGARILIRLDSPSADRTYVFPAIVEWRGRKHFGTFGALFDGAPERVDQDPTLGLWRVPIRLSRTTSKTMVA